MILKSDKAAAFRAKAVYKRMWRGLYILGVLLLTLSVSSEVPTSGGVQAYESNEFDETRESLPPHYLGHLRLFHG